MKKHKPSAQMAFPEAEEASVGFSSTNVCGKCSRPTNTVSLICEECLKASYEGELLEHAAEVLTRYPATHFELGRDNLQCLHLASFTVPERSWCGKKLTDPRMKRISKGIKEFPVGLCDACQKVLERVLGMMHGSQATAE